MYEIWSIGHKPFEGVSNEKVRKRQVKVHMVKVHIAIYICIAHQVCY